MICLTFLNSSTTSIGTLDEKVNLSWLSFIEEKEVVSIEINGK
jgi:hypothetical protein